MTDKASIFFFIPCLKGAHHFSLAFGSSAHYGPFLYRYIYVFFFFFKKKKIKKKNHRQTVSQMLFVISLNYTKNI